MKQKITEKKRSTGSFLTERTARRLEGGLRRWDWKVALELEV